MILLYGNFFYKIIFIDIRLFICKTRKQLTGNPINIMNIYIYLKDSWEYNFSVLSIDDNVSGVNNS